MSRTSSTTRSPLKLDVIAPERWYAERGLQFTCSQCGNCCTGGPGFVWLSEVEIARLAEHLKLSIDDTIEQYCRRLHGKFSLKESRGPSGSWDCIFLREQKVDSRNGDNEIVQTRRTCAVYPVRPLQCRTWPFWPENLESKEAWDHAAKRCHGMNRGRVFALPQIREIRDAKDWPQRPPTSG